MIQKGENMIAGIVIVLIFLIICGSILFGIHMYFCSENEIGMYADPKYEERIRKLEKIIKEKGEECIQHL